ncbi:MAG: alanine--tRNA ligase [Candidatus Eisenbacteria sp.]|nr:alanine--tRNA ligase [Candidatus Eisenbacteria bacterium]
MSAQEIRAAFLEFYRARDHQYVKSAPLVPLDDPTLLFTSAGMVPFKKYYAGSVALPYRRAVSIQKCLRVTDIEDVGRTPRHDTFFEMLGHFSFGDYFKKEAILWNWELFTQVLGLDPERLSASVYQEDDEAYEIWRRVIGLPETRIVRLGAEDNFWGPAGGTGACGPCSELYFDLGPELDPEHPDVRPGDETDRFVEVGNFVFPQFDRQEDGRDLPLTNRGIDTGIGLERLAMVIQGKTTIFHTDLFWPLIAAAAEICGVAYEGHEVALHVIADHVRALTFAMSEGLLPANEGRGYVLRRLIRRAAVQGHGLGMRTPFLHRLVDQVVALMETPYPEVREGRDRVVLALRSEEQRFGATLETGLAKLADLLDRVAGREPRTVSGEEAFLLYDTYGLPCEVIAEMAAGRELDVDMECFDCCMAEQKNRSRAAANFSTDDESLTWQTVREGSDSQFLGYEQSAADARVMRFAALEGDPPQALVVLDQTPFHGAAGGQVGDTGTLRSGETRLAVRETLREGGELRHVVELTPGARERLADPTVPWEAVIDDERRAGIQRHHTATHLLQAALRQVLGSHVAQAGSLVASERLRFDFTHFAALSPEERHEVERIANREILRNRKVRVRFSGYDEAIRDGVTALFGEKYDAERVRRVCVEGFSEELCGGTHVASTGEIGVLLILDESAVAAGTRRIEAACGLPALAHVQTLRAGVGRLRRLLGVGIDEAPAKVEQLLAETAELKKTLARARRGEGTAEVDQLVADAEIVAGGRYVVGEVAAESVAALRELGDRVRRRLGRGAAVLAAPIGEKTMFLAVGTDDLVAEGRVRADEIVCGVAAVTGGTGGGRGHMALGGARDRSRVPAALAEARRLLRSALAEE